jgi:uncharacterized membrane protein YfcA
MIVLALGALIFVTRLLQAVVARAVRPRAEAVAVGAIANFLDTLGIGSFAPTMAWLKLRNLRPDRLIPCTMLVGHTLPTMAQAMIFLVLLGVLVDPLLLIGCGASLLAGALLGAPLVTKMRVWLVQLIVGAALILAAVLYASSNLDWLPAGGGALAASGASVRHVSIGKIDLGIALGLALGGIPALLVAAFVVKTMPVEMLRWRIIVVVL